MHGKFVLHPFLDRRIPIITDGELVDMSFGEPRVALVPPLRVDSSALRNVQALAP